MLRASSAVAVTTVCTVGCGALLAISGDDPLPPPSEDGGTSDAEPLLTPGDDPDATVLVDDSNLRGKRVVFVTSSAVRPRFEGYAKADEICNQLAAQSPQLAGRKFLAYLRVGDVRGGERFDASSPWYRLEPALEMAFDGGAIPSPDVPPAVPLTRNERGAEIDGGATAWTGENGTGSSPNCGGWDPSGKSEGVIGDPSSTTREWSVTKSGAECAIPRRLYCFEQ